jgi:hypothetical protein
MEAGGGGSDDLLWVKWWMYKEFGNVRMCDGILQNSEMSAAVDNWWGNGEEMT